MVTGRTILVSENRLFRDGIRQMLEKSRITVVGEGGGIAELINDIGEDVHPELVIFHLTSDAGHEPPMAAVHDLHEHFSAAKLVILADPSSRPMLPRLAQADVSAILLTHISCETLEGSLQLVLSDHRLFPADIMPLLSGFPCRPPAVLPDESPAVNPPADHEAFRYGQSGPLVDAADDGLQSDLQPPLSRREHQVVECLAGGLSNKTIARRLHITEGTVKVHVKGLLRKLRVTNRTQLAIWALRQTGPSGRAIVPQGYPDTSKSH